MDTEDEPGPAVGLTGARFGGASRRRRSARERATRTAADGAAPPGGPGDPVVADPVAGARAAEADTAALPLVTRSAAPAGPGPSTDAPPAVDGPVVGFTGARFGGASRRRRADAAEPPLASGPGVGSGAAPGTQPQVGPGTPPDGPADRAQPARGTGAPEPDDEEEAPAGTSSFVRPYVITGGRTRSSFQLSIETLVSAVPRRPSAHLSGEQEGVLGLCREPRSVAELAAGIGVPLGVARVLVGDLAAAGAVTVHRTAGPDGPDLALMERVLNGLRRL